MASRGKKKKVDHLGGLLDAVVKSAQPRAREPAEKTPSPEQAALHTMITQHTSPVDMVHVAVSEIDPNPDQVRIHFNEESLLALAESIKKWGLLQPIAVERKPGGRYILVDGERRWRAAKMLAESGDPGVFDPEAMPAYVIVSQDEFKKSILSYIANTLREENSEADKARLVYHLLEDHAIERETLMDALGMSKTAVSRYARIGEIMEAKSLALASAAKIPIDALYDIALAIERVGIKNGNRKFRKLVEQCRESWPVSLNRGRKLAHEIDGQSPKERHVEHTIGKTRVRIRPGRGGRMGMEIRSLDPDLVDQILDLVREREGDENVTSKT